MATKANLIIDQGASYVTQVTITDTNGDIVDLTGYTGTSQIRKHYTSSTYTPFIVTLDPTVGKVSLSLTANTSANLAAGRYMYDVELTHTASSLVSRVLEGIVTVTPNVTR